MSYTISDCQQIKYPCAPDKRLTLVEDVVRIRSKTESINVDEFLAVVYDIHDRLHTEQTRAYLDKKMQDIRLADPDKRQEMCRNLLPYLDWYVAGD